MLATGVFPQRSGVLANKEYRAEIDPLKPFGTEALEAVRRGDGLSGGKYVRVPALAELAQNGQYPQEKLAAAIKTLGLDPNKLNPVAV